MSTFCYTNFTTSPKLTWSKIPWNCRQSKKYTKWKK